MNNLKAESTFDYKGNENPIMAAVTKAWEHWRRMICWVEYQRDQDPAFLSHPVDSIEMARAIGVQKPKVNVRNM